MIVRVRPHESARVRIVSDRVIECQPVPPSPWHGLARSDTDRHSMVPCGRARTASTVSVIRVRRLPGGAIECHFVRVRIVTLCCRRIRGGAASAWWWLLVWRRVSGFGGVHCGADVGGAQSVADLGRYVGCSRVV